MEIKVLAPAKINLTLEILGKRDDGYHNVNTIMQTLDLYDVVTLTDNDSKKITVSCNYEGVPCDERNICVKSALGFFEYCNLENTGIHIDINKKIPTQAGLAGGSSDGAAVMIALDKMFNTNLNLSQMGKICEKVGADVPFCLSGGTMLATGIGTTLTKVPKFCCENIVVCKPDNVSVSTAEAYGKVDSLSQHISYTDKMLTALKNADENEIISSIFNDFDVALQIPQVNEIKSVLQKYNAKGTLMSGSGSAVYGIFSSFADAEACYNRLKADYKEVFLCKTINHGCIIL